jgi:hypothetical protein
VLNHGMGKSHRGRMADVASNEAETVEQPTTIMTRPQPELKQ